MQINMHLPPGNPIFETIEIKMAPVSAKRYILVKSEGCLAIRSPQSQMYEMTQHDHDNPCGKQVV